MANLKGRIRLDARTRKLWIVLLAAFLLRMVLAAVTKGYPTDLNCFIAWGDKIASTGMASFYSEGYFADYPPGYLWVLGLVGLVRKVFAVPYESKMTSVLLTIVPALCDCAIAALVWKVGSRFVKNEAAVNRLTVFAAFCPALLFDTGVWKQIDGAFALPILACFWLLEEKKYLPAAVCYGVALAIKPQALMAGPVLAVCYLAAFADGKTAEQRAKAVGTAVAGAALAVVPVLVFGLPFFGAAKLIPELLTKYTETTGSYAYATVNAFNWFAALGGEWVGDSELLYGLFSWKGLGVINLVMLTLAMVALAVVSWKKERFSPLLLAAFYTTGVFTVSHMMHERYLMMGLLLTLLAAARWNDKRLLGAGMGLSITGFLNMSCIYTLVGSDDEFLSSATSSLFCRVVGLAETACFVLLAVGVYDIVVRDHRVWLNALETEQPEAAVQKAGTEAQRAEGTAAEISGAPGKSPAAVKKANQKAAQQKKKRRELPLLAKQAEPQPRWNKKELLAMLALTLVTAVVSFAYLGSMTAPQTLFDATDTTITEDFSVVGEAQPTKIWVYVGISPGDGGDITVTDRATGQQAFTMHMNWNTCFCWYTNDFTAFGPDYTVTVTNASVVELALHDADGNLLPVTGGGALFDEQNLVPDAISQMNSTYFDEIYHGRTGYEMLHKLTVYETTHPPLGKDFIMIGIAIFGMTGFGWRCAGTLFGVLLVPLMWCFMRRLTHKQWAGALAAVLLSLDFMRFAQSRIATIDIYGTFFIVLGADLMLWYCQSVLEKGVRRSVLPMAAAGVAFGLGCASKWTGIYAGAGLAVLFFGVLYARSLQKPKDFGKEFAAAAVGGVVFFVVVPLIIYIASYLPYWWKDPTFSLREWWGCQTYMWWYHSTLEATHPFESRWYTWPLLLRPVWYYGNYNLPAGTVGSIAGMGGPVVWLGGLVSILILLWRQISGRGTRRSAAVLILYATQLAPWMLVARCTFMYHYFPSSMFGLAAMVLLLAESKNERRAKRIGIVLCGVSLVLFLCFYPVLSGLPVPAWWGHGLQKIVPSWGFYTD